MVSLAGHPDFDASLDEAGTHPTTCEYVMTPLLDDEYIAMVAADVRGTATAAQMAALREPAQVERWRGALVSLQQDLERQRQDRHQEVLDGFADAQAYAAWRKRASVFLRAVERRLQEVPLVQRADVAELETLRNLLAWAASVIPADSDWHAAHARYRSDRLSGEAA